MTTSKCSPQILNAAFQTLSIKVSQIFASSQHAANSSDSGVDLVQEKVLGQGPQDNESAMEQAKDEQISDFVRRGYKSATGKDVPIADKS